MSDQHARAVEQSFSGQAAAFEDRRFNGVFTDGLEWLFAHLELRPDQLVLDVAAGTGHAARALAPRVGGVVAIDATAAMLEAGRRASVAAGLGNIVFQRGDAGDLPFVDESFEVVVCRFAVHHFEDPQVQVGEMARCVRTGGSLVIADLGADDDPRLAAAQDRIERLRDPSHARILPTDELTALIEACGLRIRAVDTRLIERPVRPWLAQTGASDEVVRAVESALLAELDGGRLTGLRPDRRGTEVSFTQRFVSVTADRPA
jgi:ubiquinone/menaquinone biosynthesis C-methylase UbiE